MKSYIRKNHLKIIFYLVLVGSLVVRVIDLNFNTPFNDEAIYVVVGRMGLFSSDWWSYGARIWMAGLPYIYPTLSALAYQTGGIVASRLLNVVFGVMLVEEVYRLTKLINLFDEKTNTVAAIIATFISAFSAVGIYVSKLATYDMLSFFLIFLAINSFLKAGNKNNGKYFFISALALYFAFLTKIVAVIFYPPLLLLSLVILARRPAKLRSFALKYFYIPLILGMTVYGLFNLSNLILFVKTHKDTGLANNADILRLIGRVSGWLLVISAPAVYYLSRHRKSLKALSLLLLALVIPTFHLVLGRLATLDKHLYLSVIFLSVIVGYFLSKVLLTNPRLKFFLITPGCLAAVIYTTISYRQLYAMEHSWSSSRLAEKFFRSTNMENAKVLTENGGAVILDLYDKSFPPTNIVTFDWINYSGMSDDHAYLQAVKDEYFDYIQLDDQVEEKRELTTQIRNEMQSNYTLVFADGNFKVYGHKTNHPISEI